MLDRSLMAKASAKAIAYQNVRKGNLAAYFVVQWVNEAGFTPAQLAAITPEELELARLDLEARGKL